MADLRSKFIEDYAGGLLNVSRQELSSTGEVLSQDGFLSDATLFVEDGSGSKSGLKLGNSLCEVVDPTTPQGAMNVRYADRTYASTRDLKIFSTAIASAQAALSDAAATSITNLENAFQLLETSQDTLQSRFDANVDSVNGRLADLEDQISLTDTVKQLQDQTNSLQTTLTKFVTEDQVINASRFYVRTGGNNNPSIIQFYKTRSEVSTGNGSLFRDDEIGAIEFAGNDGNDKVIGSKISGRASTSWDSDERGTYLGFNWIGSDATANSSSVTEWIAFGKPYNNADKIGPTTITFADIFSHPATIDHDDDGTTTEITNVDFNQRSNVQINANGQLIKSGTPAITVKELKELFANLTATATDPALLELIAAVGDLSETST